MPTKKCVEYRLVPGFPLYRAGTDGSVWSQVTGKWKRLKGTPNRYGYIQYGLCRDGRVFGHVGHRIILTTFCGPRPAGMWARHLNGNAADNRLDNLRWDIPSVNGQDRVKHVTQIRGERVSWLAKLTDEKVAEIKQRILGGEPWYRIGKECGVNVGAISCIAKDETWTHIPWPNNMRPKPRDTKIAANARLTERDVIDIKRRLERTEPIKSIADLHGVSIHTVYSIKHGKNWRWVTLT